MEIANNKNKEFNLPEFWSFPPFFTLQPVLETREKQLKLWKDLILTYCIHHSIYHFIPSTFPYFKNPKIDRQLSQEGIDVIIKYMIKLGNAEWEDNSHTSLRIILKSVESLAGEIYTWVSTHELLGTVYTIYELHSSEEYQNAGFFGCDPVMLRRSLELLQNNSKCVILKASTPDEDGVKFL